MPSTEQIINDIKAILNEIEGNTGATVQQVAHVRQNTEQIIETEEAGFANLSQGLATIIDRENAVVRLLEINDEQNRAVLCWLEKIADMECRQLRELEQQRRLQESMEHTASNLRQILHLLHGREALEVGKTEELTERLDDCCTDEIEEPGPCFEACEARELPPYKPKVGDFKPLPPPDGFKEPR